jgi:hypothetical protein
LKKIFFEKIIRGPRGFPRGGNERTPPPSHSASVSDKLEAYRQEIRSLRSQLAAVKASQKVFQNEREKLFHEAKIQARVDLKEEREKILSEARKLVKSPINKIG